MVNLDFCDINRALPTGYCRTVRSDIVYRVRGDARFGRRPRFWLGRQRTRFQILGQTEERYFITLNFSEIVFKAPLYSGLCALLNIVCVRPLYSSYKWRQVPQNRGILGLNVENKAQSPA